MGTCLLSLTITKICDKWNLTLDLWVREAIGRVVVPDEWETTTAQPRQTVVSLTRVISSHLSKEARNM